MSWLYRTNGHPIPQARHPWGDVKAAGGYVVMPPSPHDVGGDLRVARHARRVAAHHPRHHRRHSSHPHPPPTPVTRGTGSRPPPDSSNRQPPPSRDKPAQVADAAGGDRNNTLNQAALICGHYAPHYLSQKAITDALTWAAQQCGLVRDDGPAQCAATIRSGMRAGMAQPLQIDTPTLLGQPADPDNPRGWINWADLWTTQTEDRDHLIPGMWTAGGAACIYSPAGAGKSLLGLEWAALLSLGQPIHGQPTQPRTVIYIDLENDQDLLRERLEDMDLHGQDLPRLHYSLLGDWAPLDTAQGGADLVAEAQLLNADAVVIDTTSRIISGEENTADTFINLFRHTMRPLKALGIAALRLDHAGKDPAKGERGSSAKRADVDLVYRLTQNSPDTVTLNREKNRPHLPGPDVLRLRRTENPLRHEPIGVDHARAQRIADLIDILNRLAIPTDLGKAKVRKLLADHGISRVGRNDELTEAITKRRFAK